MVQVVVVMLAQQAVAQADLVEAVEAEALAA